MRDPAPNLVGHGGDGGIQVERGQTVQRGQAIGKLGQTGGVTSPQLHFELRRGGKAVDPRGHLAPLQTAQAE